MNVTLYVLIVLFAATLIRSALGFGEALFAVPLLALRLPVEVAAPLAVLVSITVAAVIVAQDWRHVHVRSAAWLVVPTFVGIPLGLWLLIHGNQELVKAALGLILIAFSIYNLWGRSRLELKADHRIWLVGCGFLAGVLGGAYGMNGPPLAIYGSLRRWSAQHFRATLQGYFLPASMVGMAAYWIAGLWIRDVTYYFLVSLPVTLAAVFLGRIMNRRLNKNAFPRFIYIGLMAIGSVLLIQALK